MSALTAQRLRELLEYDPTTGVFRWRNDAGCGGRIPAGAAAGGVNKVHGYANIHMDGTLYRAHRLAWLYMTGEWTKHEIDHINRQRADNRWSNLREATTAQNLQNKNRYSSNTSGFPGVHWRPTVGKWQARIGIGGKRISLGHYATAEDAASAYQQAKPRFHQLNHASS